MNGDYTFDKDCPMCGGGPISQEIVKDEPFTYGVGDDAVELKATFPVLHCLACDERYTDYRCEDAHSDAIAAYLEGK